jgi:hypothetical protein
MDTRQTHPLDRDGAPKTSQVPRGGGGVDAKKDRRTVSYRLNLTSKGPTLRDV